MTNQTYYQQRLEPWRVYRLEHGLKPRLVQSFRTRNDADHLAQFLNQHTSVTFTVAFDPLPPATKNPSVVAATNGR